MQTTRGLRLGGSSVLLLALCLACFGGGGGPPDSRTCDDGAPTATLTSITVNGGWSVGIQGSDMVSASFELFGPDIPDCAVISVEAVTPDGRVVWSETAAMEMEEDAGFGSRRTRGVLFQERGPAGPSECDIVITATAYGQSAQITDDGSSFSVCDVFEPPDAGPEDAGTEDAGSADAGAEDAGTEDAGSADAGAEDAGPEDAGTEDAGTEDAGTEDAGSADAGSADAGSADAGSADAG